MAFAGERKDANIAAALEERKGTDEVNKVFAILDRDKSGYIEEEELKLFLKNFDANTRELINTETKVSHQAGEPDGERKIRAEDLVRK